MSGKKPALVQTTLDKFVIPEQTFEGTKTIEEEVNFWLDHDEKELQARQNNRNVDRVLQQLHKDPYSPEELAKMDTEIKNKRFEHEQIKWLHDLEIKNKKEQENQKKLDKRIMATLKEVDSVKDNLTAMARSYVLIAVKMEKSNKWKQALSLLVKAHNLLETGTMKSKEFKSDCVLQDLLENIMEVYNRIKYRVSNSADPIPPIDLLLASKMKRKLKVYQMMMK